MKRIDFARTALVCVALVLAPPTWASRNHHHGGHHYGHRHFKPPYQPLRYRARAPVVRRIEPGLRLPAPPSLPLPSLPHPPLPHLPGLPHP